MSVAWSDLIPVAVVLSLGNTFWTVVLRLTAGPAIRTDAPFQSWLRESAILLPLYVAAVLAAAALVLRRRARSDRPGNPGARTAMAAVTGAGVVTGVLFLVASVAWDLVLERRQVVHMASMRDCAGDCLDFLQHSTTVMQLKSIGYGSVFMVLTDLVLVALLVAFRGGRLPLARVAPATGAEETKRGADQVVALLGAMLLGAAAIHAAVIPEHLSEWPLAGEFFWLLVIAETVVGVVVLRNRGTGPVRAAAWLSMFTVLLWMFSRTRGLPFGPEAWEAEPVGVADLAATSLELASLGLALALLWGPSWLRRPASPSHVRALGLASVVAVTAIGVAGSALPVVNAFAPVDPVPGDGGHHGHAGHEA
jgi:hypothetical protein